MESTDDLLDVGNSDTPTERINGEVTRWEDGRRFGLLIDGGGNKYIAFPDDIPADRIGRKYLKQGERISFVPDASEQNKAAFRARQIVFLTRPLYERFPADYHELVSVESWDGEWGIAMRPLGGRLFLVREETISEGIEYIEVGTALWTKIGPPRRFGGAPPRDFDHFRAVGIEICGYGDDGQLLRYPLKESRSSTTFNSLAVALERFAEAS